MKKILLTSGGLSKSLQDLLLKQLKKEPNEIKILFVPNAAMHSDGAREGIALCMFHLLDMGILTNNIFVYNLEYILSKNYTRTYSSKVKDVPPLFGLLSIEEMSEYDVLLFGGGDAGILLNEINRTGFNDVIKQAVENGLLYLGISAGSMVAAGNLSDNLGYVDNPISVHCEKGTPCGSLPQEGVIHLTDTQAIWIDGDVARIIN